MESRLLVSVWVVFSFWSSALTGTEPGAGVIIKKDIPYLGEARAETLDAYLPPPSFARPVPAVVLIHGGGWGGGRKDAAREVNIGTTLAAHGYAVFSISYRLNRTITDENGDNRLEVAWPKNLYDCKTAVRYLRAHAGEYGLDPDRIATMGGSAGGHLAMLVGVTANHAELNAGGLYTEQSNAVACIINLYGRHDVSDRRRLFAGETEEETDERVRIASPTTWFGPDTPPILVLQGTEDQTVPVRIARDLVRQLAEHGIEHEYVEVEGGVHSFHLQPRQMDLRPVVLAFLEKHLGR
jgi:acetyl esterase/lipase